MLEFWCNVVEGENERSVVDIWEIMENSVLFEFWW